MSVDEILFLGDFKSFLPEILFKTTLFHYRISAFILDWGRIKECVC